VSRKSLVLLILLAILPLAAVGWLGRRVARAESERVESQYRRLLEERLAEENRGIEQYFARLQRELSGQIDGCGDSAESLRQLVRQTPQVRQIVVFNRQGDLVHPRPDQPISGSEREFLSEIAQMIRDKDLVRLAFPTNSEPQLSSPSPPAIVQAQAQAQAQVQAQAQTKGKGLQSADGVAAGGEEGWLTWYWGRGVNLMYWRRWNEDRLTVVALSRARWMADLLAVLPETKRQVGSNFNASTHCICLVDSSDQVIYQWGSMQPTDAAEPAVESPVVSPLASWRFKYYVEQAAYQTAANRVPLIAGLAGMACGLLGLVIVLYREYSRDMREAMQRVNFVNQVSHELKTPLTNIRLYADLLERDLDQLSGTNLEKPRSRLSVITSESQRLSRLITHVLTFARTERNQLSVRTRAIDVDQLVRDVVERFQPALEADRINVDMSTCVGELIWLDPDIVEQILDNLISNAQRYAANGRHLGIRTFCDAASAIVEVSDQGPGINAKVARRIFQPFVRGATGLSDATGTGIGLSIARRLARLQGGDVVWVPSHTGATFRLILPRKQHHESVTGRG
jgi:signal transduction histidine kinase/type II secretory pathway pseudopilin PulG